MKTIISRFIMLLLLLAGVANSGWGETVTYTVSSTNKVTSSGTAPSGSSASYSQTYNTAGQMTANNSSTLTLSGYAGKKITAITLSMKSNSSKGAGYLQVKAGTTEIAYIANTSGSKFNTNDWNGAWSTSYVDVSAHMHSNNRTIASGESVTFYIKATESSLYIQSYTITYEDGDGGGGGGSTGAIEDGDYVIAYNGNYMKNTVESNRLEYSTICNITSGEAVDPDASIVWHIAKSGDYYTIYNASVAKYAASNGTKNQAQLLESGSDNKSLWTVTGTGPYEFVNKYNAANSVNANLRNNGTYGFACYGTGTGGALTLYPVAASTPSYTMSLSDISVEIDSYVDNPVSVSPTSGSLPTITYESDDTDIATVNSSGRVTGKASGTCTITATAEAATIGGKNYPAKSVTCTVTVTKHAQTVTFANGGAAVSIVEGKTNTNVATTTGDGAITYESSNTGVATVDSYGKVTAISVGTCTITATAAETSTYASATATYSVTVTTNSYYQKVTSSSEIGEGEYLIVYEINSTSGLALNGALNSNIDKKNNTISVDISSEKIPATTAAMNAAMTFEANGTNYYVKTKGGYYICSNGSSGTLLAAAGAYANTVTYLGGSDKNVSVMDVVDELYLQYNSNTGGQRFRYYTGSTQQAICLYKRYTEEVEEDDISFPIPQYTMNVGSTYTQKAKTKDASAEVVYSSSNTDVAIVNSATGEVTAIAIGTTTITGTIKNTDKSATYLIHVVKLNDSRYVKVTSAPSNWGAENANEYLIVYETATDKGNVMNGRGSGEAAISALQSELTDIAIEYDSDKGEYYIQGNNLIDSCSFIIENESSNYYIKTSLWERYIGKHSSQVLSQDNKRKIAHTITWSSGYPLLRCTWDSKTFTLYYNTAEVFGYYADTNSSYKNISLFRKENYMYDPEMYFANEQVYMPASTNNTEKVHTASGYNGTITYQSLNTDVATVNPSTGAVTAIKQGKAIILATGTATTTYYGGSAQYTVMVSANGAIFTTSQQAIVAKYEGKYYAMKNTIANGEAEAIEVEVVHEGASDIVVTPNVDDLAWTITGNQTPGGSITIRSEKTGKYLSPNLSDTNAANLKEEDSPYSWSWTNHLYEASSSYNQATTKDGGADAAVKALEKEGPYSQYGTKPYRTFLLCNGTQFKNYGTDNISYHVASGGSVSIYSDVPTYHPMRYAYRMYPANGNAETYVCTDADPILKGESGNQNYVATLKVASVDESRVATAIPNFKAAHNTIINGEAQVLDITDKVDYYAPSTFSTEKVIYNRTNTKGWNSVCLPFAVRQTEVESLFGTGSKIYLLSGIDQDKTPAEAQFTQVTNTSETIGAGVPCLVWCPNEVASWEMAYDTNSRNATGIPSNTTSTNIELQGFFQKGTISGTGYYKLANDGQKFGYAKSGSSVTPFRLALQVTGTGSSVQSISIQFDENDEQEIVDYIGEQLEEQERTTDGAIYDLNGRRVYRVTIPGIYIQNGKKIVKK